MTADSKGREQRLPLFPLQCECHHARARHEQLASHPMQYGACGGRDEWGEACPCTKFKLKEEVLP